MLVVAVFAVTQLSHLVVHDLTAGSVARAAFLLLVVWWAWIYTTWMVNWFDPASAAVRAVLVGVMLASLLMAAALPAQAQSPYTNYNRPEVLVDLSALDQLGPAPTVPDSRFVLHPPRAMAADQNGTQVKVVLHPPGGARVADSRIEHIGSVTIDYSALPPAEALNAAAGPRIALHLPEAQTVAAAVPPANAIFRGPDAIGRNDFKWWRREVAATMAANSGLDPGRQPSWS